MRKVFTNPYFKAFLLGVLLTLLAWSMLAVRTAKLKEPSEYEKILQQRETQETTQSTTTE